MNEMKTKKEKKQELAQSIEYKISMLELKRKEDRAILGSLHRTGVKTTKEIKKLNELLSGKSIDKAIFDSKHIRELYSVVALKTLVITEVMNAYKNRRRITPEKIFIMQSLIISAFDNSDEWWANRDKNTLEVWIDEFLQEDKK